MYTRIILGVALSASVLLTTAARAQQRAYNPEISVIGDVQYEYRDKVAQTIEEAQAMGGRLEELEINFAGYLNPYARADVYIGIHGVSGPVDLEEAYMTILRLPLQMRFGKYLLRWGTLNTEHRHQWQWLSRPIFMTESFGQDGATAVAFGLNRLQPVGDTALILAASAFRADFFGGHAEENADTTGGGDHGHGSDDSAKTGVNGRIGIFRSITDTNHLEAGASYMWAPYDEHAGQDLQLQLVNFDLKYKWTPDAYKGIWFHTEVMYSDRDFEDELTSEIFRNKSWGAFAATNVMFRKRWDIGAYYDWAQDIENNALQTTAWGGWFDFRPVEETMRFAFVARVEESDFWEGSAFSLTFQALFGLGPHRPHSF